jgi:hypothetical protein
MVQQLRYTFTLRQARGGDSRGTRCMQKFDQETYSLAITLKTEK